MTGGLLTLLAVGVLPRAPIWWLRWTSRWWTPRVGDTVLWESPADGYQTYAIVAANHEADRYRIRRTTPTATIETVAPRAALIFHGRDHHEGEAPDAG